MQCENKWVIILPVRVDALSCTLSFLGLLFFLVSIGETWAGHGQAQLYLTGTDYLTLSVTDSDELTMINSPTARFTPMFVFDARL